MQACDVCRKETTDLTRLAEEFRSEKVKDICGDCFRPFCTIVNSIDDQIYDLKRAARRRAWLQFVLFKGAKSE